MSILIIIYSLFFAVLSWRRLDLAVLVLIALLPGYMVRFQVFGIPFTLLESMILIAFAVWAARSYQVVWGNLKNKIKSLRDRQYAMRQIRYPFDVEIVLVLVISWIAVMAAGFSDAALGIWKAYFFEPVLVYILIVNLFTNNDIYAAKQPRMPRKAMNKDSVFMALAAGAFWVSVIAIVERFTGLFSVEAFWPRVTGVFPYPNAVGLYLGPLVVLMISQLIKILKASSTKHQAPNKFKIQNSKLLIGFFSATIILSLVAILLAGSEGAAAGVLAGLIFFALYWLGGKFKKIKYAPYVYTGLILLFVAFSPLFFLHAVPENKYFDFGDKGLNYLSDKLMLKDLSGEIRKQQWRETWQVLTESPRNFIFGAGLSGYQGAVAPYHQEGIYFNKERDPRFYNELVWGPPEYKERHWQPVEVYMYPHNLLLNFWTELGLAGMLLFGWIIIKFFTEGLRGHSRARAGEKALIIGLVGSMIVIAVHGVVDVPYFKNDLAVLFWVLAGLLGVVRLESEAVRLRQDDKIIKE